MTYLFVGTTSYTFSDFSSPIPYTHSIPLPTGTMTGDMLLVGFWGGSGHSVPDARLTTVSRSGPTTPAGAYGTATDLSDVQVETDYIFNNTAIIVAALRDAGSPVSPQARYDATPWDPIIAGGAASNSVSIAFVVDLLAMPDDDADWISQDTAIQDDYNVKCYSYAGSGFVPQLNVGTVSGGRTAFWMYFDATLPDPTAVTTTYLRQRQSPVRTPSRVRPPVVRQRQRPEVTT